MEQSEAWTVLIGTLLNHCPRFYQFCERQFMYVFPFLVSISHVFFLNLFLGIPSCPGGCMTLKEKIQQRGEIEAEKDIIAGHELPDTKVVKSKTTVYDSPLHGGEMKL